jgi:ATP-dependent DNA ligase
VTAFRVEPMDLRSVADIPTGSQWLYEPKWDGFRCIAHRDGEQITLLSKNGQPLERYFPEVAAALGRTGADVFTVDGELVVPVAGALSFDALQGRIHPAASRVALLARTTPARYILFDMLRSAGESLVERPLRERRAELERFARAGAGIAELRLSPATTDRRIVDDWFAHVGGALDGVVAKRLDLAYAAGTRDGGVKIKKQRTADCVVGGMRFAAHAPERVGSLLLGLYDSQGRLDYIGFCSAFAAAERRELGERLAPYRGGAGFTGNAPGAEPSRWSRDPERDRSYIALRPEVVLEVGFDQVTAGRIRHGTKPLRWRTDKSARSCTTDQLTISGPALDLLDL